MEVKLHTYFSGLLRAANSQFDCVSFETGRVSTQRLTI